MDTNYYFQNQLFKKYDKLNHPKDGKVYLGIVGPNMRFCDERLFHETWLEDIQQDEATILYFIQTQQILSDERNDNLYRKVVRGPFKDKIVRVKVSETPFGLWRYSWEYGEDFNETETIFEGLLYSKSYCFLENELEEIDQEIGKIEFEKQLREYFLEFQIINY